MPYPFTYSSFSGQHGSLCREHVYNGSRFLQNYDGSSNYGGPWRWAGAQHSHASPIKSTNPDTASQEAYNTANSTTPQRKTYVDPVSEGDERHLYGQGKPMAKNASGDGTLWVDG